MSQFPLEGGNPATTRYRGRDTRGVGQPGITETPNAPGLIPLPPGASRGQRMAAELMQALGVAGDLGQAVDRFTTQQRIEADRKQAEAERAARVFKEQQNAIDAADRGDATTNTLVDVQEIERAIQAGEMSPQVGEDIEAFTRRILRVDDQGGIGSVAYQQQRYETGAPKIAAALANSRLARIETARKDQIATIQAGAAGASDMAAIDKIVAGVRTVDPDIPEDTVRRDALTRALKYQAEFGPTEKPEKFDTFAKAASGVLSEDTIAEARQQLATRQAQAASLTGKRFDEAVAGGIIGLLDNKTTPEMLEHEIRREWSDKVSDKQMLEAMQKIRTEKNALRERVTAQEKKTARAAWEQNMLAQVSGFMDAAANTGGAAVLPRKFEDEIELANGDTLTVSMTGIEAEQRVVEAKVQELSALPAERAFMEQMSYFARNGVVYDKFSRIMSAGGAVQLVDAATVDPKKPVAIPSNTVNGYALWRNMGRVNQTVRDRHLSPDSDSAKLYELAQIVEEEMGMPPEAALAHAVQGLASRRANLDLDSDMLKTIDKAAATHPVINEFLWFDGSEDVKNTGDLKDRIIRAAKAYITVNPDSPNTAIDRAIKKVKANTTVINGFAVNTTGRLVPDKKAMDEFATKAIRDYIESHPGQGYDEDNETKDGDTRLTLVPGRADGTWMLFDAELGTPVPDWNTKGLFTGAQIVKLARDAKAENEIAKKNKKSRLWIQTPAPTTFN